ncbi:WecB/TagA/CpsF family glycosyltransferase [Nibrella saemangeumensis]|uniref:WecB/TagA/CpsF family glycosyltransferase n=1 Tax=Nibrella saemangeumensis TaxID=1084526 RepID=A0ABP8N355_9BACT
MDVSTPLVRPDFTVESRRLKVISLNIAITSYTSFQQTVIGAAHRGDSGVVCFANAHMTVEAARNADYARAVNGADWVVADGMPLVWALKALYKQQQDRICGMSFLPNLLRQAAQEDVPVFFYGSTSDVLERTAAACQQLFPGLRIVGTLSPPFRDLSAQEEDEVVEQIVGSGARLVLVALGCPKQEKWMMQVRNRIPAIMLGIGGALPVLAGEVSRAPGWMQRAGFEWLYRLGQEPRRLFKRYAIGNTLYILFFLRQAVTRR